MNNLEKALNKLAEKDGLHKKSLIYKCKICGNYHPNNYKCKQKKGNQ